MVCSRILLCNAPLQVNPLQINPSHVNSLQVNSNFFGENP